ncbi:SRPBCC family protein [Thermocrispum agreste]|uniref:SRPBCC family protein n=1 Tax=Thermocrispum agreste TaxID=37925 RepID=UPI000421B331|nr:SRPBCC family protein [Thermocrispum agreste]
MADSTSPFGKIASAVKDSPVAGKITDELKSYAKAKSSSVMGRLGSNLTDVTQQLNDAAENGGPLGKAGKAAADKLADGGSPGKAALSGAATGVKEKVKSMFGGGGGSKSTKATVIVEDIDIGAPVDVVYDQWTQFEEFSSFTKGVESVEQSDQVESTWRFKVAMSRRTVQATVTEQVPFRRIAWTSDGAKGSSKGVVTFHPLADDLTKVLLVLEYFPSGFVEKTGNIWRAVGRRARLDLKHFRRFVTTNGEATGSWRGEIADGEVVRGPDDEDETTDTGDGEPEEETAEAEETDEVGEEAPEEAEEQEEDEEREKAPA